MKTVIFWNGRRSCWICPWTWWRAFPNLELLGDRQLFLTRHRGILSYSDTAIDVNCGELLVRVRGRGLELLSMTAEEMRIGGVISSVELAR